MSGYNLRSQRRKQVSNCYLANSQAAGLDNLNSVVILEKLKFPKDIDNYTFHLCNEKIITRRKREKNGKTKNIFLICFLIIIFLSSSCFFYFQDDLQQQFDIKRVQENAVKTVHSYSHYTIQFFRESLKKIEYFKTKVDEKIAKHYFITETEHYNEPIDSSEAWKSLVRSYLIGMKEEEKKEEKPMSFIEEQCRKPEEVTSKMDTLFTIVNNEQFDKESLVDYALESRGGKIVTTYDTKPYGLLAITIWGYDLGEIPNFFAQKYFNSKAPSAILTPWKKPGDCWAFKGSYGRVKIELWEKIYISAITLDHISKEQFSIGNSSSAPKKFSVVGFENENEDSKKIFLGTFEYKIGGPPVQRFSVSPLGENKPCKFVEITIESNHGNEYTCLYRVRVHGRK